MFRAFCVLMWVFLSVLCLDWRYVYSATGVVSSAFSNRHPVILVGPLFSRNGFINILYVFDGVGVSLHLYTCTLTDLV